MTEFKKGDRVKCVSNEGSSHFTVGKVYVVNEAHKAFGADDEDQLVTCTGNDGRDHGQYSSRWELVSNSKFKVGDRVRVTATRFGSDQTGKIGTVVSLSEPYLPIKVRFEKDRTNIYDEFDLEPASKFKAGDKVRYIAKYDWMAGNNYTVKGKSRHHTDGVEFECGGWDHERNLELVPEVAAPKFKVGDRVQITEDNCGHPEWGANGELGTITSFYDDGKGAGVKFDRSGYWSAYVRTLIPAAVAPQQHIVARVFNGKPNPSGNPFVHASLSQAQAEAERLANKAPGTTFEVYALVSRSLAATRTVVEPAKTEAA